MRTVHIEIDDCKTVSRKETIFVKCMCPDCQYSLKLQTTASIKARLLFSRVGYAY